MADTKEAKPETSGEGQLNIKVRDAEGNEVQFKIKKTTKFGKLMTAYCDKMGAEPGSYRFLFDGNRISEGQTPEELELEDGDCIDALLHQQGGRSVW
mmetsp:Transcript_15489/g.31343  ORF Transcript_15489/g.31343 Transcript_15489/m.31343 type:complete len:97 (+) Transcript_15489:303-593(+)|eukprot:CAMPEP_0184678972 /NCGR_PEP_ID=MMETSP0312-20130426/1789_1 /TAXON_ID=31354 /ORGANISM="Compsopogon coeruleus, Strain SAG 36.94" /LENGTH=96 /DNA_ID=CAMNT_0027128117 /DNA_START=263 /DNA_END=553 /DNA_ORIENTATION=-